MIPENAKVRGVPIWLPGLGLIFGGLGVALGGLSLWYAHTSFSWITIGIGGVAMLLNTGLLFNIVVQRRAPTI